jgi:hypothetical protein
MTENTNLEGKPQKLNRLKKRRKSTQKPTVKKEPALKKQDPLIGAPGVPQPPQCILDKIEEDAHIDRFPKREINIKEVDEYVYKDPTLLLKNGKPWVPEENGWRARLCTHEQRKYAGMGIWQKVYPDDGICFADDEYSISRAQGSKVKDAKFGDAADGVYRNGAFLCLAPLEAAIAKDLKQVKDAKELVDSSMLRSADKLQEKIGGNPRDSSFRPGPYMKRYKRRIPNEEMAERARYAQTGRKSFSVPDKIS